MSKLTKTISVLTAVLSINLLAYTEAEKDLNHAIKTASEVNDGNDSNATTISIDQFKKSYFTFGRGASFLDMTGKNKKITTLYPAQSILINQKFGTKTDNNRNKKITNNKDIETLSIIEETTYQYNSGVKIQKKYQGARDSIIGEGLSNAILSSPMSKKMPLLDEYKKQTAMFWILDSVDQLRALQSYLEKNLDGDDKTMSMRIDKPVLMIKILNDPFFETLTYSDIEFLYRYFNILNEDDTYINQFFNYMHDQITTISKNIGNAKVVG